MKKILFGLLMLSTILLTAQEKSGAVLFFENLKTQCGKSFEGEIKEGNNDTFKDKNLSCILESATRKPYEFRFL